MVVDQNVSGDSGERIARGTEALNLLIEAGEALWPSALPGSEPGQVLGAIKGAAEVYSAGLAPGAYGKTTMWEIESDDLVWTPIPGVELDFVAAFVAGKCDDPDSSPCRESFRQAVDVLRVATLAYRTIAYMAQGKAIHRAYEYFEVRTRQWDTYFGNGIPQWPWELLLINGPLYGLATRDEMGSVPPPTYQWLFFHPDVAMEYVPSADDGQQFKPSLMVEVVGIDLWEWNADGTQGGWLFGYPGGFGLVGTYTDRAGSEDWAWGGVLHINHAFNIGVTLHDGDPGYFVSANIAKLFRDATSQKDWLNEKLGR